MPDLTKTRKATPFLQDGFMKTGQLMMAGLLVLSTSMPASAAFYYEGLAPYVCDEAHPGCPELNEKATEGQGGANTHPRPRPSHGGGKGEAIRTQTRESPPQK